MEELDLKELLLALWEKKIIIGIVTAVLLVIGVVYSFFFVTPMYESYASVLLGRNAETPVDTTTGLPMENPVTDQTITQTDLTLNKSLISTYGELIKTKTVASDVLKKLKENPEVSGTENLTEASIMNNISVSAVDDTAIIKITVKNEDPNLAQAIASELLVVFTEKINEAYNINNVYVVDQPTVDTNPVNVNHIKDIVIFVLIGIVLSVMYVLVVEMLNVKIKTVSDIEKVTNIPVIAEIAKMNSKKGGSLR